MLHAIVVLDIAWPWASEAYGLCRLCEIIRFYSPNRVDRGSYGVLTASQNELAARARKGVDAGAGVVVLGAGAASWLSARLRRAAALVGCWCRCRCCQLAKRTGAGVSCAVEVP